MKLIGGTGLEKARTPEALQGLPQGKPCISFQDGPNEPRVGICANMFLSKRGTHYSRSCISEFMKAKLHQLRIMPFLL